MRGSLGGGVLSNRGLSVEGLSDSPLFNFCRFRVDTRTGGIEVPCVLTFVGKKNIINKIPDLLTKMMRKPPENWM